MQRLPLGSRVRSRMVHTLFCFSPFSPYPPKQQPAELSRRALLRPPKPQRYCLSPAGQAYVSAGSAGFPAREAGCERLELRDWSVAVSGLVFGHLPKYRGNTSPRHSLRSPGGGLGLEEHSDQ